MKLAVINQHTSTGGWRYLYYLLKAVKGLRNDYDITVITLSDALTNDEEITWFEHLGIRIKKFTSFSGTIPIKQFKKKKLFHIKFLDHFYNLYRKHRFKKKQLDIAYAELANYDCIFYSWPYDIDFIPTNKPVFFIPHDFIFSHFFGFHSGHLYTKEWYLRQKEQLQKFVDYGAKPIVSSEYIASEFNRVFPNAEKKPSVVYLSSFNDYEFLLKDEINAVLKKYAIENDYVLYANNWALHKNMQPVIGAYYQVKQKYPNIKLIITGYGTEGVRCKCNTPYYLDHVEENEDYDVLSLGLLKNDDFSAILQGAKMIINSSLCEAGSGSALDAWNCKVHVVFSSIPAFMQQLDFLGTKATVFDPRNSDSIASAILYVLDNPDKVKEDAEISYQAMKKYTWEKVAKQYIDIFEQNMPAKEYQELTKLYPRASKDDIVCYQVLAGKHDD